jgi:hypothetical protein
MTGSFSQSSQEDAEFGARGLSDSEVLEMMRDDVIIIWKKLRRSSCCRRWAKNRIAKHPERRKRKASVVKGVKQFEEGGHGTRFGSGDGL